MLKYVLKPTITTQLSLRRRLLLIMRLFLTEFLTNGPTLTHYPAAMLRPTEVLLVDLNYHKEYSKHPSHQIKIIATIPNPTLLLLQRIQSDDSNIRSAPTFTINKISQIAPPTKATKNIIQILALSVNINDIELLQSSNPLVIRSCLTNLATSYQIYKID